MWATLRAVPWWGWGIVVVVAVNVAVVVFGCLVGRASAHAVREYENESQR
jgi:hypothetical protein